MAVVESLRKAGQDAPATESAPVENAEETALAARAPQEIAPSRDVPQCGIDGMEGEFDESDIKFPSMKIVAGSGPLSARFNGGTIVFADEELLAPPNLAKPDPDHAVTFVPFRMVKQFRENVSAAEYAAGKMPEILPSKQAVSEVGGTTEWIDGMKPSHSPCASVYMLIERPEQSEHPGFSLEFDGRLWAVCVYYASGTGYNHSARVIFNTAKTSLHVPMLDGEGNPVKNERGVVRRRTYLPKCLWKFRVVKRKAGDFDVFSPELRLTRTETGPEAREYLDSLNFDGQGGDDN